jgi:hypothetical protein
MLDKVSSVIFLSLRARETNLSRNENCEYHGEIESQSRQHVPSDNLVHMLDGVLDPQGCRCQRSSDRD